MSDEGLNKVQAILSEDDIVQNIKDHFSLVMGDAFPLVEHAVKRFSQSNTHSVIIQGYEHKTSTLNDAWILAGLMVGVTEIQHGRRFNKGDGYAIGLIIQSF